MSRKQITVTVSGPVGCGKSAIAGEIEIMCKALDLSVEWVDSKSEKNMTGADWTAALESYKPAIKIVEAIDRASLGAAQVPALPYTLTAWCCEKGQSENVPVCKECAEACAGYSEGAAQVPAPKTILQQFKAGVAFDMIYHGERRRVTRMGHQRAGVIWAEAGSMLPVVMSADGKYGKGDLIWLERVPEPTAGAAQVPSLSDELLEIVRELTLATNEGDDIANGTHYLRGSGHIHCKGSFLHLIERARAAVARAALSQPSQQGTK